MMRNNRQDPGLDKSKGELSHISQGGFALRKGQGMCNCSQLVIQILFAVFVGDICLTF